MRIKKMNWFVRTITFNWASAVCLAPFGIYFKKHYYERTINHEKIHWKQQMEMLIVPFYLWYSVEWLLKIPINGKKAYMSISFEREAYSNDHNLGYISTRKHFAWFKRILK